MTHLSIDRQPEAVKRFFDSLLLPTEGSVIEMDGRPLARMLPVQTAEVDRPWTPELNERRAELIDRKFAGGLAAAEEVELEALTASLRRFVDRVAPVPLEEVRQHHRRLVEMAGRAEPNP